ncbi:MAG: hypothetical protein ACYC3Q_04000 [Gemmatimonadaceae bacterium]
MSKRTAPPESLEQNSTLDAMYQRYDAYSEGRRPGDSRPLYAAILARLAENGHLAEARGWRDVALERMRGHLQLTGVAPNDTDRSRVPDLRTGEQ